MGGSLGVGLAKKQIQEDNNDARALHGDEAAPMHGSNVNELNTVVVDAFEPPELLVEVCGLKLATRHATVRISVRIRVGIKKRVCVVGCACFTTLYHARR